MLNREIARFCQTPNRERQLGVSSQSLFAKLIQGSICDSLLMQSLKKNVLKILNVAKQAVSEVSIFQTVYEFTKTPIS